METKWLSSQANRNDLHQAKTSKMSQECDRDAELNNPTANFLESMFNDPETTNNLEIKQSNRWKESSHLNQKMMPSPKTKSLKSMFFDPDESLKDSNLITKKTKELSSSPSVSASKTPSQVQTTNRALQSMLHRMRNREDTSQSNRNNVDTVRNDTESKIKNNKLKNNKLSSKNIQLNQTTEPKFTQSLFSQNFKKLAIKQSIDGENLKQSSLKNKRYQTSKSHFQHKIPAPPKLPPSEHSSSSSSFSKFNPHIKPNQMAFTPPSDYISQKYSASNDPFKPSEEYSLKSLKTKSLKKASLRKESLMNESQFAPNLSSNVQSTLFGQNSSESLQTRNNHHRSNSSEYFPSNTKRIASNSSQQFISQYPKKYEEFSSDKPKIQRDSPYNSNDAYNRYSSMATESNMESPNHSRFISPPDDGYYSPNQEKNYTYEQQTALLETLERKNHLFPSSFQNHHHQTNQFQDLHRQNNYHQYNTLQESKYWRNQSQIPAISPNYHPQQYDHLNRSLDRLDAHPTYKTKIHSSPKENLTLSTPGHYFKEMNTSTKHSNIQTRLQWIEEQLTSIIQCEPVKKEALEILYQEKEISGTVLLRKIKQKGRYMGAVTLGMIMYNLIDLLGSDLITRNPVNRDFVYKMTPEMINIYEKYTS